MRKNCSYSVINTHKSMLFQTLPFFGVEWTSNSVLISKLLKGYYNIKPIKPKKLITWDVSVVLRYLWTLYPLSELTLKQLTYKLIALIALTTAARAQTLLALDITYLSKFDDKYIFQINQLLKTSRPGVPLQKVILFKFHKKQLCVLHTLDEYLSRTTELRKTNKLFISFKYYNAVTTSTLARWLKQVLLLSGIDASNFSAHSFRGAATSKALSAGLSLKQIMDTANWKSAKTFYKFYYKDIATDNNFSTTILSSL